MANENCLHVQRQMVGCTQLGALKELTVCLMLRSGGRAGRGRCVRVRERVDTWGRKLG